jgi:hypothetical protein
MEKISPDVPTRNEAAHIAGHLDAAGASILKSAKRKARAALPASLAPRGLTISQAAALAGLREAAFATARARGDYPNPTLPGGRIDRMLMEQAMDRLSGLLNESEVTDPLGKWLQGRHARSA